MLLLLRVYLYHTVVKLSIASFAEFVAVGMKLSAIFMSEHSKYTASICAGVWDTQELCCFALWWECSLLVNSIFGPTLVNILLANITWNASFCQPVSLSWNHQCCIKTQCSESNRRAHRWYHSNFQCLKQLFNNCFAVWSLYQMNVMLYNVCHKIELFFLEISLNYNRLHNAIVEYWSLPT